MTTEKKNFAHEIIKHLYSLGFEAKDKEDETLLLMDSTTLIEHIENLDEAVLIFHRHGEPSETMHYVGGVEPDETVADYSGKNIEAKWEELSNENES